MPRIGRGQFCAKALICGAFCLFIPAAVWAAEEPLLRASLGWTDSPQPYSAKPQVLLPGMAFLIDEAEDPALWTELAAELKGLYSELYGKEGWRMPFEEGGPLRIFVARSAPAGIRRIAAHSLEKGRFASPELHIDATGLGTRQIVREVARQIALATLLQYGVRDGSFLTAAAAELLSGEGGREEDREALTTLAASSSMDVTEHPTTLGRLYLEEILRGAGDQEFLRLVWERASESREEVLSLLLRSYMEATGEADQVPLLRFAARLLSSVEPEAAPSRVSLLDLEGGALDASPPGLFRLRHRSFLPGDGIQALQVSWPADGGAAAAVVRYRDPELPADVLFLSAGDLRALPLNGVARVDWIVAGGESRAASLRAPAEFQALLNFPFSGLSPHAAAGREGPRIWWTTATHEGLAGWAIFREEVLPDGRIARTGPEILPSSDRAEEPFAYAYLDPAASSGTYYRYTVWAVTVDGLLSRAFSATLRTLD